jgi:hypothetical protein
LDFVSSALTGAVRIGVQVVVAQRRPGLEIFCNLHNDYSPSVEVETVHGPAQSHRFQRVFIDLVLVNLGGIRAESITFKTAGTFKRELLGGEEPGLFQATIWQMAPGQLHYLMRIEQGDLHNWEPDGKDLNAKRMGGLKTDTLTISVHYDGPSTLLNRILRLPRQWRGLKQYEMNFIFDPQTFAGDLPPPNYA